VLSAAERSRLRAAAQRGESWLREHHVETAVQIGPADGRPADAALGDEPSPGRVLWDDDAGIVAVCDRIDAAGIAPGTAPELCAAQLSARAFVALRDNRVGLGGRIVRTLIRAGLDPATVREALLYLTSQQRRDGAFGYVSPLAAVSEEIQLRFRVLCTVNALWTIREALAHEALAPCAVSHPRTEAVCR
jgi:hypothetical protein